jgi:hypothetical protein
LARERRWIKFFLFILISILNCNEGEGGNDVFAKDACDGFNKNNMLQDHVGNRPNSFHNMIVKRCNNLIKSSQSIGTTLNKQKG